MATLLTKDYTKIATIVLQDSTYDNKIYLYGKAKEPNAENLTTTIYLKATYYRSAGSVTFDSATAKLDGTSKTYGKTTISAGETVIFNDIERTITHNSNGVSNTKSISISWDASYGGDGSTTVEVEVQDIPLITISDITKNGARGYVSTFDKKGLTVTGGGWDFTDDPNIKAWNYIEGNALDKTFTDLKPNTTYYLRTYVITSAGGVNSKWASFTTKKNNVVRLKVNGNWKESIPYMCVGGVWKEATPYINVNGSYKEVN